MASTQMTRLDAAAVFELPISASVGVREQLGLSVCAFGSARAACEQRNPVPARGGLRGCALQPGGRDRWCHNGHKKATKYTCAPNRGGMTSRGPNSWPHVGALSLKREVELETEQDDGVGIRGR